MVAREHSRVDRRLLPPRRSDNDRRLGERRLEVISLDEDRRKGREAVRAGARAFVVKGEVAGPALAHALRPGIERNRLHSALLDLALVDDLTGLYNRRGFLTLATRDLRLARRGNETLL